MRRVPVTGGASGIGSVVARRFAAEAAQKGMTVEAPRAGYAAGTALRPLVDPEDVAEMAVFLASPAAKMVTGQAIAVDGFTINPTRRCKRWISD